MYEPRGSTVSFESGPQWARDDSWLPAIQEKLNDPNYSAAEVLILISYEMVRVYRELDLQGMDAKTRPRLGVIRFKINALQKLANSVRRAEASRAIAKVLDFDGPQFAYVFEELLNCFEQTLQEGLGKNDPATARNLIRQFRDLVAVKEAGIRNTLNKMARSDSQNRR